MRGGGVFVFVWEFVFVGRKRLGYRVQMDTTTTATDQVHSPSADALALFQRKNGTRLVDPSLVLLRIENNGTTDIDDEDYAVLGDNKVGIHVNFPGRRVAGLEVTELSAPHLRDSFGPDSGLGVREAEDSGRIVGLTSSPRLKAGGFQPH